MSPGSRTPELTTYVLHSHLEIDTDQNGNRGHTIFPANTSLNRIVGGNPSECGSWLRGY